MDAGTAEADGTHPSVVVYSQVQGNTAEARAVVMTQRTVRRGQEGEMNQTIRELEERKSVRIFTKERISAEDRKLILTAAVQAPSAGNQQLYTILDVTDPALKKRLAVLCDHQEFIADAPMVLVFLADTLKWRDAYISVGCAPRESGPGDLVLAIDDALLAAENAVTAAWSLGIGSCLIGDVMENRGQVKEALCLPDGVFPAALLIFGHPTEQQARRPKPLRPALSSVVQSNVYRRRDAAELREAIEGSFGGGSYEKNLRDFCARKFDSGFSREMSRSVAAYLREYPFGQEDTKARESGSGTQEPERSEGTDEVVQDPDEEPQGRIAPGLYWADEGHRV